MKYKVGDKIKIVRATAGCYGAEGKIGTVTNEPSTDGLCYNRDGFNVDCGYERVWRIGFESECELLDELTAEEATRILGEICCENQCSYECPICRAKGGRSCWNFRRDKPEEVLEILKQWKKEHEKKEVETEFVNIVRVIENTDNVKRCVHEESIPYSEDWEDAQVRALKEYCKNHDGNFFAVMESRCVVKEQS